MSISTLFYILSHRIELLFSQLWFRMSICFHQWEAREVGSMREAFFFIVSYQLISVCSQTQHSRVDLPALPLQGSVPEALAINFSGSWGSSALQRWKRQQFADLSVKVVCRWNQYLVAEYCLLLLGLISRFCKYLVSGFKFLSIWKIPGVISLSCTVSWQILHGCQEELKSA